MIARNRAVAGVVFIAAGIATAVIYAMLGGLLMPDALSQAHSQVPRFLALTGVQFLLLLAAAWALRCHIRAGALSGRMKWLILGFAVVFRLCLLPQTPWLSNDIYRYVWDGRLVTHGVNPYTLPPAAAELASLRDDSVYGRMSHTEVHTVYPPLLQYLFAAGAALAQTFDLDPVIALKAILTLVDLLLAGVLLQLAPGFGLAGGAALLYAWHPMPIIEIAGSGHSDIVGVLCLLMAIHAARQNHHAWAALFLALAFLVKFLALLLLPFWMVTAWRSAGRRAALLCLVVFAITTLLSYAPFLQAGAQLLAGLLVYSAKWRFNDSVFAMLFNTIHTLLPDRLVTLLMVPAHWEITETVLRTRRVDLALHLAKASVAVLFLLFYAQIARRFWLAQKGEGAGLLPQIALAVLAAFFLLSPTLQPWYLLWLLPLLCLNRRAPNGDARQTSRPALFSALISKPGRNGLWLLTATVLLSYLILHDYQSSGVWQEAAWWKWLEFGPPLVLLLWGIAAQRAGQGRNENAPG